MQLLTRLQLFFLKFVCVLSLFLTNSLLAQNLPNNISSLSDDQLVQFWNDAKSQGYTLEQIKSVAKLNGVSSSEIGEFEQRISQLENNVGGLQGEQINNSLELSDSPPVGFTNNSSIGSDNSNSKATSIFGFDFFNNPNISFTPNLNVATPDNYQLGPGDELVINIWGAAENNYNTSVDREGTLRIPNVGPVQINGVDIKSARQIIIKKLRRVYAGIGAPDSSPYKVFVNISLSKVRSIQVNIIGEVKVPGTYTLSSLSTVLNALYASGGPTENGTFREIKLIRNGENPVFFDVYNYLIDGNQSGNLTLRDNDMIIVAPYVSRVSISGAIKRPGQYELKKDENFSDLLNFVSGFEANAFREKFTLERIKGDGRILREIEFDNILNEKLFTGDIIQVKSIINKIENKVSISGPVYRPGDYEFEQGLTVKELIDKASGLTKGAYLDRGLIYRGDDSNAKTIVPFSLNEIINGNAAMPLESNDNVRLFNKDILSYSYKVIISGGVRNPGSFDYYENFTIEDIILMAGGFTDKANPNIIDIYRKIEDDDFETLTESFKISISDKLNFSNTSSFKLMPGDRISVRLLKGINDYVKVEVSGEVNYPGSYSANSKNERISDFLSKAGGLSKYAFVNGATLIRVNPFYKEDTQSLTSQSINDEAGSDLSLNNKKEFRVGIDLADVLKNPANSKHNLVLKDGDRLIVPSIKSTVKTEGEILVPSLVREDSAYGFKEYINKSGGFSDDAIRRKAYIIYPNGEIASTKNFLFIKNYPKVIPGSVIVVPKKEKNPDPLKTEDVLGITSGFATIALLVDRIFRN